MKKEEVQMTLLLQRKKLINTMHNSIRLSEDFSWLKINQKLIKKLLKSYHTEFTLNALRMENTVGLKVFIYQVATIIWESFSERKTLCRKLGHSFQR